MHLKAEYTVIRRRERERDLTKRHQIVDVAGSRSSGSWSTGSGSSASSVA
jgi:hypothetical protein